MFANKEFSFVGHFKLFLIVSAILVVTGVAGGVLTGLTAAMLVKRIPPME